MNKINIHHNGRSTPDEFICTKVVEYKICSKTGRKGMPREIKKKEGKKCILYKKIIARTRAFVNCIRVFRLSIVIFDTSNRDVPAMRRGTQIIISQEYRKEINVKYVTRVTNILGKIITNT